MNAWPQSADFNLLSSLARTALVCGCVCVMANTLKCNNCNIVVCEVLSYIQYKHDVMDNESIIQICDSAFSEKEIEVAKTLLFESATTSQRKVSRRKDGKSKRNIEDIICFKEVDPDTIPIFVAGDLQKLPPISIDHVDAVTMLKNIITLRNEINSFKDNYATVTQLQEIQMLAQNMKCASTVDYENINTRKRGAFLLDSGPIGLSCSINTVEGISAEQHDARNSEQSDSRVPPCSGTKTNAPVNPISVSRTQSEVNRNSAVMAVINVLTSNDAKQNKIDSVSNSEKKSTNDTMASVLRDGGEWKQEKSSEKWIQVQRKRFRNRFLGRTGKAAPAMSSQFKAADIKIPLFISNVNKEVSSQHICEYIQSKAQVTAIIEKINMKQEKPYNAFKISIPKQKVEMLLNEDFWPDGVTFRHFVHLRRRSLTQDKETNER